MMCTARPLASAIRTSHLALGLLWAVLAAPAVAGASSLSFEARIEAASASGDLVSGVSVGDAWTGTLTFDDATGVATGMSFEVGGHTVAASSFTSSGDLAGGFSVDGAAVLDGATVETFHFEWLPSPPVGGDVAGSSGTSDPTVALTLGTVLASDANGDGAVGAPDFIQLSDQFGSTGGSADFTGDGFVGAPDFVLLSAEFGSQSPSFVAVGSVSSLDPTGAAPEPSAALLFLAGGVIVSRATRRA